MSTVTGAEERKVVSVLFCDLVGFTAASADADPEDVRRWLAPYHDTLRSTVERFGGTVEKLTRAAAGDRDGVCDVLERVAGLSGMVVSHEFASRAPALVRAGLAVGEADLAARVAAFLSPLLPTRHGATASARASLAEYRGVRETAAAGIAAAAAGWAALGNKVEQAYALLGQGRCGSAAAAAEADELFSGLRRRC